MSAFSQIAYATPYLLVILDALVEFWLRFSRLIKKLFNPTLPKGHIPELQLEIKELMKKVLKKSFSS